VGAPHIRQRLYFVAHSEHGRREVRKPEGHRAGAVVPSGAPRWLADGERFGRERRKGSQSGRVHDGPDAGRQQGNDGPLGGGETGTLRMAYPDRSGQSADSGAIRAQGRDDAGRSSASGVLGDGGRPGPTNSFWRDADWLFCRDGKWRPVEPGTFPLGNGLPARVGRLRGYGNAVVPQVAAEFVASYLDVVAEAGRTNQ
jgi:DNA (cytosine-5)-methyltransferase 1